MSENKFLSKKCHKIKSNSKQIFVFFFVNIKTFKYYLISFTENSDSVFCFYCGIELKEWKEGDTPWGKHAKWSPNCVFVGNNKGREFIEMERLKESDPEEVNMLHQLFLIHALDHFKICLLSFNISTMKNTLFIS